MTKSDRDGFGSYEVRRYRDHAARQAVAGWVPLPVLYDSQGGSVQ